MNDRLVTALGALAALAVLAMLLGQGGQAPEVGRPTTAETGPDGYAALARWLEADGVRVVSLRRRLDVLTTGGLGVPATGNLLITTMPHRDRMRRQESARLLRWVAGGNTLLVMAALDDTPEWSVVGVDSAPFLGDLARMTGLEFARPSEPARRMTLGASANTRPIRLEGLPEHPLMRGVGSLAAASDYPAVLWEAKRGAGDVGAILKAAREARSGAPAIWEVRRRDGQVIVCGTGSPLTNRMIGKADNAAFVASLLTFHLAPGGAVIFDDMHQGLSTLYDPEAFFGDPRLGATLLFVLGLWGLYLLGGSQRLVPPLEHRATPSQTDFVAGVGGFLARKLSRPDAGRLMVSGWLDELRRRGAVPDGDDPPWRRLAVMPAVDAGMLARLRDYHEALGRGEDVDLREVHNTLQELRRMLA